ncbi:hypothetical protein CKALI_11490 [Corynebacterium kalinowskii]|uniref:Secreted protein n=1 Tax=Corynebacterium kalinowskii TaxID=2675216 RepID=A0A6B8VD60_9CORY|nr:membrane lipoprotein lipid attachment site-containing protein [Corynebacterium kalinowskii]QGU03142.1 hypothetical protein CKALI_11490 [Corynebacterium kalinowskii]
MKKVLFAISAAALLTACGSSNDAPAPATVTVTAPAPSTSTPTPTPTSSTPTPTSEALPQGATAGFEGSQDVVDSGVPIAANGKGIKKCNEAIPGLTMFTDDTIGYSAYCENLYPEVPEPPVETQPTTEMRDLSKIPVADGGTCPAAICGYGHDANGKPNPSSGEIQKWWMDCIATHSDAYCRANDPYR